MWSPRGQGQGVKQCVGGDQRWAGMWRWGLGYLLSRKVFLLWLLPYPEQKQMSSAVDTKSKWHCHENRQLVHAWVLKEEVSDSNKSLKEWASKTNWNKTCGLDCLRPEQHDRGWVLHVIFLGYGLGKLVSKVWQAAIQVRPLPKWAGSTPGSSPHLLTSGLRSYVLCFHCLHSGLAGLLNCCCQQLLMDYLQL